MAENTDALVQLAKEMEARDKAARRLDFLLLIVFFVVQVVLLNVGDLADWPSWVNLLTLIGNVVIYCVATIFFDNRSE